MTLFQKMQEAARNGTREEFAAANRAWYEATIRTGICEDCGISAPLHHWSGRYDLICEGCDEVRRLDLDARYDDQRAHERSHAPEIWGF